MRNKKIVTVVALTISIALSQVGRDEVVQITFPTEGVTVMSDSIDVTFTLASFFDIDTASCTDCDGYIKVYLNGYYNTSATAIEPIPITNLYEGSYLLKLEAVDPSGNSFDPATFDTVNFNVDLADVDNLCPPTGFSAIGGVARNFLDWNEPVNASSENPFPALPGSADYHTGSTTNTGFTETSLIKADAGGTSTRQSGWIRFDLAGMIPFVTVDSIIFNYYVNDTNWPYWSATPVSVDPLDGDPGALHADINTGYGATDAYLYRLESSTFTTGPYSNTLINGANTDLAASIQQGFFVMGIVDRDGGGTYHVYLDGWNEANPPSLDVHWSIGDSRGVHMAPAMASDLPYSNEEVFTYKQTVESGLDVPAYLQGIREYENEESGWNPPTLGREVIDGCGDLQNYLIYSSDGTVVDSVSDTTIFIHENLTNGTEYCYYIVANYTGGESEVSETLCATPEAFIASAPTNLRATAMDEEAFLAWTEPGTPNYVFYEDFTNGIPSDWTIVNLSDDEYTWASPHDNSNTTFSGFGDNLYAICDSDDAPSTIAMDEELITPSMDFSSIPTPYLQFTTYYNDLTAGDGTDYAELDVSTDGGTTWTTMLSWDSDQGSAANPVVETVALDSVAGDSGDVKIRFHYNDNNTWAWYWAIDDIIIYDSDPTTNALASRETDGDFLHYQVITGDSVYVDSVSGTNTLVTGLTNGQTYNLGVTAAYYPDYKSDTVEVSVTPTWLYGDISGTVYGPDGTTAMDSAVVTVSGLRDTTGSDGSYSFVDLDPGTYTVRVTRSGFDSDTEDVTVVAQEDPVVQDFTILPILGKVVGLTAEAGDEQISLEWMTPGGQLPGEWEYYHDGTFENAYASAAGGSGLATLFVPSGFPATIQSIRFHVSDFGNPTDDVEVNVYHIGDDGTSSLLVGPETVSGVADDFVEVDIDDATIDDGGFLVATYNVGTSGPYISVDEDNYNASLYFGNNTDGWSEMGGSFGIFAVGSHEALIAAGSGLVNVTEEVARPEVTRNSSLDDLSYIQSYGNEDLKEYFLGESGSDHLEEIFNSNPLTTAHFRTSREDSLVGYNVYQIDTSGDTAISNLGPEDTTLVVTGLTNYTEYCFNVKAIWDTEDFDTLESKYTNEACAKPFKLGDVDFDNDVDVVDIPLIVDFVLGTDSPSDEEFRGADINDDRTINIQDIVMTVDIIFGTPSSRMIAFDPAAVATVDLDYDGTGLHLNFDYDGVALGFQFVLDHNPSQIVFGKPLLVQPQSGLMLRHFDDGNGNYTVVAVNINGGGLDLSQGTFLSIPIAKIGDAQNGVDVSLDKMVISGPAGQEIPVSGEGISLKFDVVPTIYALHQNYPNPFNPVTEIRFDLPEDTQVELTIYNLMGQRVRSLVSADLKAGFHRVTWNGMNDAGHSVSTGMYFYTVSAGSFHDTKKMVLLK